MSGQILVVSGPSGCGKSTLIQRLVNEFDDLYFSISTTTRAIRADEKEGVNYHYVSIDEFKKGIESNEFLEWAMVHRNYYGTSLKPALNALKMGKSVIFDIDVQGYKIAKSKFDDIITSVFITTPSKTILKKRLKIRGTDDTKIIEHRLFNAAGEMEHIKEYDYFLINDDFEHCYNGFRAIYETMQLRTSNIDLRETIEEWISI